MHMSQSRRIVWSCLFASLACGVAAMVSCEAPPSGPSVDGRLEEWSPENVVKSDPHHVYLRFRVPGEPEALQASSKTVALYLDADGSVATGRRSTAKVFRQLGVDAEIHFSPRTADGKQGRGMKVVGVSADGSTRAIPNKASGVIFSPTYASNWYEMRLDRGLFAAAGLDDATADGVRITGIFVTLDDEGKIDGFADPFEVHLGPAATTPKVVARDVPEKPAGSIRVVSYNVEKSKPVASPAAFGRVLTMLDPDVMLFQEWDEGDGRSVEAWLRDHVPGEPWTVRKSDEGGVAVASRLPLAAMSPDALWMSDGSDKPRLVRVVSAIVTTPAGPVSFSSLHLKCCGGAGGREEETRQNEARAIHGMLASAEPVVARVVGGDFNLVGTRVPLDILRQGLDESGGDLAVAEPVALGGDMLATWRSWGSEFTPGRLDYVVYSPTRATVVGSFVLDTELLAAENLARSGLDRGDSAASDHMPVVVDLVIK
jgi:endonuclease/exonuclease/phosphatase family metal-dependent hydrolase